MPDDIIWEERRLGTIRWSGAVGAYVLTIPMQRDLPLSFDVHTKVGHEIVQEDKPNV